MKNINYERFLFRDADEWAILVLKFIIISK